MTSLRINPFRAIRPELSKAAEVAAVPYDVVNTAEAAALAKDKPNSFLHVSRAEIDLPADTDTYGPAVYEQSRSALQRFVRDGVLVQEPQPMMYLYRQVMDHRAQIGLVCCVHIDDYTSNLIKKHEKTRKDKEDDRTRHVLVTNANAEPVFLTYRDTTEIETLIRRDTIERPMFHFNAPDGVTHTVWPVHDWQPYVDAFAKVPCAYVADGHHRSASAARAGAERRQANPNHTGNEEYNWFLAVLFPASQLRIMPYNRVVKDLNGLTPAAFIQALGKAGTVAVAKSPAPEKPGVVCVYLNRTWYRWEIDPRLVDMGDPIGSLDVSILQNHVLTPILGIGDIRTDKRIDFVGGIRGTDELARRVDSGEMAVAFSMYPTSMDQLLAVSDVDAIMPPKSTWFEPKLRSGLFVHMLD